MGTWGPGSPRDLTWVSHMQNTCSGPLSYLLSPHNCLFVCFPNWSRTGVWPNKAYALYGFASGLVSQDNRQKKKKKLGGWIVWGIICLASRWLWLEPQHYVGFPSTAGVPPTPPFPLFPNCTYMEVGDLGSWQSTCLKYIRLQIWSLDKGGNLLPYEQILVPSICFRFSVKLLQRGPER